MLAFSLNHIPPSGKSIDCHIKSLQDLYRKARLAESRSLKKNFPLSLIVFVFSVFALLTTFLWSGLAPETPENVKTMHWYAVLMSFFLLAVATLSLFLTLFRTSLIHQNSQNSDYAFESLMAFNKVNGEQNSVIEAWALSYPVIDAYFRKVKSLKREFLICEFNMMKDHAIRDQQK